MLRSNIKPLSVAALTLVAGSLWAQTDAPTQSFEQGVTFFLVGVILLLCLGVIVGLVTMLMGTVQDMRKDILREKGLLEEAEKEEEVDVFARLWHNVWKSLNDSVDIEHEEEIALDHDYDGIRELDNNLPPWWKALFYFSIVWGIAYLAYYHVFHAGPLSAEEFQIEMSEAKAKQEERLRTMAESVDENTVTQLTDASDLNKGKSVFIQNCIACHGDKGQGGAGPNLTDENWIHGGGIHNIFHTIKYGVPGKAMISWQATLKPQQMQQVASYIMTLGYVSPDEGGKAPQGDVWKAETDSTNTGTMDSTTVAAPDSLQADDVPPDDTLMTEN